MTQPFKTTELDAIWVAAKAATQGERFVGGPFPAITVCIQISPPWLNGPPEDYDPGQCEPLQEFWPNDRGEAPANVKADAELYALLDPATVLRLVEQIKRMTKELSREDHSHGETLKRCEYAEEWADKFAYAIAPVEVIGEHSNLNNPWQEAYELLTPQYEVNELKSQVAKLVELASKADTYHKLLCEVYVQAGNGAGPTKRHCLTPSVRDAIRDVLFPDGGHKSGEQPKTEAK